MSQQHNPPSQFLLLSQPRTGCHLLERMLSKQSSLHTYLHHPFGDSGRYPKQWLSTGPLRPIPVDLSQKHDVQMEKGLRVWREGLQTTRGEGKGLYVHFHPLFALRPEEVYDYLKGPSDGVKDIRNPTGIPDELLLQKGTVPVLTIRNPRLQVPSLWRAGRGTLPDRSGWMETLALVTGRWSRLLYDWYMSRGIQPLVVDADDYMSSDAFVRHLCQVSGLDPAEVLTMWAKTEKKEVMSTAERNYAAVQETLLASQGPEARRAAKNVDLNAEERSWDKEFGREVAEMLRDVVKMVIPDYQYLWERRLVQPESKL